MKYGTVKDLEEEKFHRLTGVKRSTFSKMAEILWKVNKEKKAKGGRKKQIERGEYATYGIGILAGI